MTSLKQWIEVKSLYAQATEKDVKPAIKARLMSRIYSILFGRK